MDYDKKVITGGRYVNKEELFNKGTKRAKIVSETNDEPSQFKDKNGNMKTQAVCKVMFEGENESVKTQLNQATINGLVDAFGKSSKLWMGHYLDVRIDKQIGKKFYLYLIPQGFVAIEDDNGYIVIVKQGSDAKEVTAPPLHDEEEEIKAIDIPF